MKRILRRFGVAIGVAIGAWAIAAILTLTANNQQLKDDSDTKSGQIDQLILTLDSEQKSNSAERAKLLQKQDDLLGEVAELQRRQTALMDYLRANGIAVPATISASSSTGKPSSGGDTPKARGKAKGHHKKKPSQRP